MPSNLHRCPQCKTVGKVNRSKARSLGEKEDKWWNTELLENLEH